MIRFSKIYPKYKYPLGFLRLLSAYYKYFDHPVIDFKNPHLAGFLGLNGHQTFISSLRNKHKGERGFVIANGPGLNKLDTSKLKDEITLGCNGIYSAFPKWGFTTNYYFIEDNVMVEQRAKDVRRLKGPMKFTGLHNSYCFPISTDMSFFHTPIRGKMQYTVEEVYPEFSRDVGSIVYLGATITFVMLQFAYHLGFDEIYLIGLDHNYGELPKKFKPHKTKITSENFHLFQNHFDKNYFKIGDTVGASPNVKFQEMGYAEAKKIIEASGRKVYNASVDSKLDVFDKIEYDSLF